MEVSEEDENRSYGGSDMIVEIREGSRTNRGVEVEQRVGHRFH